ncbi:transposase (plasmid) [Moellerella wisconsensis]|uniref:transposase n=1 Tax=Moellerella wisconsensis TaxID=158849 RepID=UPI001F4EC26B|nr:transposase [Moellerella wisconsensis]UNH29345.1 transposase [Moellerella wisconsensis]
MNIGAKSDIFHWLESTISEATTKGWRCIPAKDGRPIVKWSDDRLFPFPSEVWSRANQIGLVLNRAVLLDFDGKVELSELFAKIGVSDDFMRTNLVQWRVGRTDSLHWLFKLPRFVTAQTHYHSQDSIFMDGVDLKCMRQLVYLKPDKVLKLPEYESLPDAPEVIVQALELREERPRTQGDFKEPSRLTFNANVRMLDKIKMMAEDAPYYWYEQLGQKVDKTGHSGCPKCGGKHRFSVLPNGRFRCNDCLPKGGSIVDFLQWRDNLTVKEAKDKLILVMMLYG